MAVKGKKYQDSAKTLEKGKLYDPSEALSLVCGTAKAKFDETIELHVRLGVDSRHADQQVRGRCRLCRIHRVYREDSEGKLV